MLCPYCSHQISPIWNVLFTAHNERGQPLQQPVAEIKTEIPTQYPGSLSMAVILEWGRCHNEECHRILVKAKQITYLYNKTHDIMETVILPSTKIPPSVDKLVPDPFAKDFIEASLILDDSPRMSSVLSRRILADLLEKYLGLTDYNLATRIEKFTADTAHPSRLRDNLQYLREIGDFSAHTMKDDRGQIVDVGKDEAEWTLKIVADLFDYFIVAAEKDRLRREAMDKKLADAGRKPIKKPTP